jgi:hypothetical protein
MSLGKLGSMGVRDVVERRKRRNVRKESLMDDMEVGANGLKAIKMGAVRGRHFAVTKQDVCRGCSFKDRSLL